MNWLPEAVVMNYHKRGDLELWKFFFFVLESKVTHEGGVSRAPIVPVLGDDVLVVLFSPD